MPSEEYTYDLENPANTPEPSVCGEELEVACDEVSDSSIFESQASNTYLNLVSTFYDRRVQSAATETTTVKKDSVDSNKVSQTQRIIQLTNLLPESRVIQKANKDKIKKVYAQMRHARTQMRKGVNQQEQKLLES